MLKNSDVDHELPPLPNYACSAPDTANGCNRVDSPEGLVRRETRAIRCLKFFAILVLVTATVSAATIIFNFTQRSERDAFRSDFALISEAISHSLLRDVQHYFSCAQSIATTITILLEAYNTTQVSFTVPLHRYQSLTSEIINIPSLATWNPLIRSDEERRQFEKMVSTKETEGFFSDTMNPLCFVCGSDDIVSSTPTKLVTFPGIGQYRCDELHIAGVAGAFDVPTCSAITSRVIDECSCNRSSTKQEVTDDRRPSEGLFRYSSTDNRTLQDEPWNGGPYLPTFLDAIMVSSRVPILFNHLSHPTLAQAASKMIFTGLPQLSQMIDSGDPSFFGTYSEPSSGPTSILFFPVQTPDGNEIAGALSLGIRWSNLLQTSVPRNGKLAIVVIESSCGQTHTYKIKKEGMKLDWIGVGNLHDRRYSHMVRQAELDKPANLTDQETCNYRFSVYPSRELEDQYITTNAWVYSASAVLICVFTSLVFAAYDSMVRRRQEKIMKSAKQTDTIVASLFPESVRGRLYSQQTADANLPPDSLIAKNRISLLSSASTEKASIFGSAPIADFFPACTVMFIDIANFTAWCSEREPSQVFILLENIYHEFDEIADQLGVFKVETIGDSYVAVAGLPTPRKDHAVVMTRFASMCLSKMEQRVKELEVSLGPSTGDLRARCGLHSGPVTAGVLRGAKARFQLFGDTVNTASRMEASSEVNRIHASEQTVGFLKKDNKEFWVKSRREMVRLKGKGTLQTYWLDPRLDKTPVGGLGETVPMECSESGSVIAKSADTDRLQRKQRLIEWNVEVLHDLLLRVAAAREAARNVSGEACLRSKEPQDYLQMKGNVIDEMTEIVSIPEFNPAVQRRIEETVVLVPEVKKQLREYVSSIAQSYRDDVPFHNFEHASHVIMSATKLMKRIMSPEGIDWDVEGVKNEKERKVEIARQVHNVTYGLSSDPLMQFSVVFSALIHDVDHTGLTNKELIDMNSPTATVYRSKCVAEQNSVDVAWFVLMEEKYRQLRECIFSTPHEESRFRELIVDAVMATDIADKELGELRKSRWEKAFSVECSSHSAKMDMDRKATIVFEHIIQASDVSHCMQHWHTYQKFNSRLFEERYLAYRKGVAGDKPPWVGWYKGEIWFFDNYIIPLAQKLNDCGVFGVSYHEYLNYAQENRLEWERKGLEIVESLRISVESKYEGVVF
jgi:class 3 adenylate cyclase